ncbi:hypothetical protein [Clostridium folliculivorans]|uniref:Uncharacterized protein n=1 Tax=Clostridium folliculivorans TaxID=2886038 RepID=A0A9W5Y1X2_9CLOT|nr:hypothetical protein [Clostridium folliculivorans]GKU25058.1 hypothetical protein CFOLD11_18840 [Clostridium folliculivorans]GKU31156.1 hypothetical protein CFB3_32630 [Clostridium folliculivorans]
MNIIKYLLILISVLLLSVIAVTRGIGQAFIVGGTISIIHGVLMLKSKKYENSIYSKLGKPVEFGFPDKEKFYKDQGVNCNSKVNKYFNSEMLMGFVILVQSAINNKLLITKLSVVNAALVGGAIFVIVIFFDILSKSIARRSKEYSDFYLKILCILIFITIPFMFFGLIWVLRKQY